MTLDQRAIMHLHKGKHVPRAAAPAPSGTSAPATAKAAATPTDKTIPIPDKPTITPSVIPKVPVTGSSSTSSSSSSSTSSTSSTTSSSSTSSSSLSTSTSSSTPLTSSSTSSSAASIIPQIPETTSNSNVATPTMSSSSLSSSETAVGASVSQTAAPSSGLGTGTILAIVGGVLVGILVICLVAGFFLRRLRKRVKNRAAFDAAEFRRSAAILDEKDEKASLRPRPPSMIERKKQVAQSTNTQRNLHAPAVSYPFADRTSQVPSAPPSLYGSDAGSVLPHFGGSAHYAPIPQTPTSTGAIGAIPGAYGVPPPLAPYNGAQYDQAGFGAPPIPGTYGPGAYAPYGTDPRYPQYPQNQGYPQYSPYLQQSRARFAQQQQPQMFGYGQGGIAPQLMGSASLPNPFPHSPSVSPAPLSPSPAPAPASPLRDSANSFTDSNSSAVSDLQRQPTQSSVAPPAYEEDPNTAKFAAMRDRKVKLTDMSVLNESTVESSASTAANGARNQHTRGISSHTIYDEGDAYGGM